MVFWLDDISQDFQNWLHKKCDCHKLGVAFGYPPNEMFLFLIYKGSWTGTTISKTTDENIFNLASMLTAQGPKEFKPNILEEIANRTAATSW